MERVIIVGGGPGGLAAAIAVRAAGLEAAVFERNGDVREVGSGLTLWPNAMKALGALGSAEAVGAACRPLEGIELRSWRGAVLSVATTPTMERLCGGTGAAIARAELIAVLSRLAGDIVQRGARCTGFRCDPQGVTAQCDDGRQERGALLIGADGLHSVVAAQLFGTAKLRYAGYPVWRGIAEFELPQHAGVTSMGPGAQFGYFPLTRGRVYWFASVNAPAGSQDRGLGPKRTLLERFGSWHEPIRDLIEATHDARILCNDIYDRDPWRRWGAGPVTLIGDAAHPSEPTLGQGACQAIEDAAVLGACLRDHGPTPLALRAYEARRIRRANALTSQARWMGWLCRWQSRPACWIRERIIGVTPEHLRLRHLRWLCHFEP
jgi:2-polyprenyl-6-methoxyphenol hydroxylase-like FAD-dependent oxidoreductase